MTTAIIGDGQMGLVLAALLAERAMPVRLWGPFPREVEALARDRRSPRLHDFTLDAAVEVTADGAAALRGASMVVNAIPTQYIRPVWSGLAPHVARDADIVSVAKGIENESMRRPSEILAEALESAGAADAAAHICVLSGPTIAAELARRLPATMVAASGHEALARRVQHHFSGPSLRIYSNPDLVGVELAGALKNVIALAAGIADGLELGFNAKSALLARGLVEIARLGVALGAREDTFYGIAGVGDLATTCFSPEGRNRSCGERLGRGESLASILKSSASVVEGVPTTRSVMELCAMLGVEMPITAAVSAILFEGLEPARAIEELMRRELKSEQSAAPRERPR